MDNIDKSRYYIGYGIIFGLEFCMNIVDYFFIFYGNIYDYVVGKSKRTNTKD